MESQAHAPSWRPTPNSPLTSGFYACKGSFPGTTDMINLPNIIPTWKRYREKGGCKRGKERGKERRREREKLRLVSPLQQPMSEPKQSPGPSITWVIEYNRSEWWAHWAHAHRNRSNRAKGKIEIDLSEQGTHIYRLRRGRRTTLQLQETRLNPAQKESYIHIRQRRLSYKPEGIAKSALDISRLTERRQRL